VVFPQPVRLVTQGAEVVAFGDLGHLAGLLRLVDLDAQFLNLLPETLSRAISRAIR
jgi:hypothetical protein